MSKAHSREVSVSATREGGQREAGEHNEHNDGRVQWLSGHHFGDEDPNTIGTGGNDDSADHHDGLGNTRGGGGADSPKKRRIILPHRVLRREHTPVTGLRGDVASGTPVPLGVAAGSGLAAIRGNSATEQRRHSLNNTTSDSAAVSPRRQPAVSSAMGVYERAVSAAAGIGRYPPGTAPAAMSAGGLVSAGLRDHFDSAVDWFNERRYRPVNVSLNTLQQEQQLEALKDYLRGGAATKKKNAAAAATLEAAHQAEMLRKSTAGGGGDDTNTFMLTQTGDAKAPATPQGRPLSAGKKPPGKKGKKTKVPSTSMLNGKIGLRRIPSGADVALDNIFATHSIAVRAREAPASVPQATNLSAIHRGLAPHVGPDGTIILSRITAFLSSLVPPEVQEQALATYIRPFVRRIYESAHNAGGGDALDHTTSGGGVDIFRSQDGANNNDDSAAAMFLGATCRHNRSTLDASTTGGGGGESPGLMASTLSGLNKSVTLAGTARAISLSKSPARGAFGHRTVEAPVMSEADRRAVAAQQEERFFDSARVPYVHVMAAFEMLVKPPPPPDPTAPDSQRYVEDPSGAVLSARLCFALACDPNGYILRQSVHRRRDDALAARESGAGQGTDDYDFNVVQGLMRAFTLIAQLEEERFALLARKGRRKPKKGKPIPMPTIRQFHMSLDEFTSVLMSDPFVTLSFLPYIIKTEMSGRRAVAALEPTTFYGKSQVSQRAVERTRFRELKAAENILQSPRGAQRSGRTNTTTGAAGGGVRGLGNTQNSAASESLDHALGGSTSGSVHGATGRTISIGAGSVTGGPNGHGSHGGAAAGGGNRSVGPSSLSPPPGGLSSMRGSIVSVSHGAPPAIDGNRGSFRT